MNQIVHKFSGANKKSCTRKQNKYLNFGVQVFLYFLILWNKEEHLCNSNQYIPRRTIRYSHDDCHVHTAGNLDYWYLQEHVLVAKQTSVAKQIIMCLQVNHFIFMWRYFFRKTLLFLITLTFSESYNKYTYFCNALLMKYLTWCFFSKCFYFGTNTPHSVFFPKVWCRTVYFYRELLKTH